MSEIVSIIITGKNMAKYTETDSFTKEDTIFVDDIQTILTTMQKMTSNKGELTNGQVIEFFVNVTVNLIVNSNVCKDCFTAHLDEMFEVAEEADLITKHTDKKGTFH